MIYQQNNFQYNGSGSTGSLIGPASVTGGKLYAFVLQVFYGTFVGDLSGGTQSPSTLPSLANVAKPVATLTLNGANAGNLVLASSVDIPNTSGFGVLGAIYTFVTGPLSTGSGTYSVAWSVPMVELPYGGGSVIQLNSTGGVSTNTVSP